MTNEFTEGEWVTVWSGSHEGLSSTIKGTRGAGKDREYLTSYGWHSAGNLVRSDDKRLRRYDAQGYCDNPSRGY